MQVLVKVLVKESNPAHQVHVTIMVMSDAAARTAKLAESEAARSAEIAQPQLQQQLALVQQELQQAQAAAAEHSETIASMKADCEGKMAGLITEHLHANEAARHREQQNDAQLQTALQMLLECRAERDDSIASITADHVKVLAEASADHEAELANLKHHHSTMTAKLTSQHAMEAKDWESAVASLDSDSKQFKYTVRGASGVQLSGSVPRSIFNAEPDSALAHMYNGKWEYAKDDDGRAVVNSNPDHWPVILDWLSFGTVPSPASNALVSECKYWQLDRLVAAIDRQNRITQSAAGSHDFVIEPVTVDGNTGFTISGLIHHFPTRLSKAVDMSSRITFTFSAAGRDWRFILYQEWFGLCMCTGPSITKALWKARLGTGACAVSTVCAKETPIDAALMNWGWTLTSSQTESMMHPRMLSLEGSLHFDLTATFK